MAQQPQNPSKSEVGPALPGSTHTNCRAIPSTTTSAHYLTMSLIATESSLMGPHQVFRAWALARNSRIGNIRGAASLVATTFRDENPAPEKMAAPAMEGVAAMALQTVMQRVHLAVEKSGRPADRIRVVAVSKTKPVSLIQQVYDAGHRSFGENYVQEFVDKAPQLPSDIEWHFIGHLQSNKVKALLSAVPNLDMVESVDDEKIANQLDRVVSNIGRSPLKVLVQVNTSGEVSKSGVEPSGCVELAKHVHLGCPNLVFSGLMTIGMLDYTSTAENFKTLSNCRTKVCEALGITEEQCELSMGMSGDFEQAIEMGSTNIRIGSTIFGPREYPKKTEK